MSVLKPAGDLSRGFKAYVQGVRWLRANPRYFWLLTLPWLGGLASVVGGIGLIITYAPELTAALLFAKPLSWPMLGLFYLAQASLLLSGVILVLVGGALIMSIAASPIYESISVAVEREVTGTVVTAPGFGGTLRILWLECKKVVLILTLSVLLLLIPGLNVVSGLVAAFLAGWDLFDYPMARRGWPLRARLRLARREGWAVMGLGLWLAIPFTQMLTLPLAVAGATFLNLDALARDKQLNSIYSQGGCGC